jgi:hypothetical protein
MKRIIDIINESNDVDEGLFDGLKIRKQIVELQGAVTDLYEEIIEKNPKRFRSGNEVMMHVQSEAKKLYDKLITMEGAIKFRDWWEEFSSAHARMLDKFVFSNN